MASDDENPDLFWGLRGGGGNFGVVTAFHLRLHPIGPIVLGGMPIWPAPMAGDLVRFYREFMRPAPDDFGTALAFITAPPAPFVPEPVRGQPVVGIVVCYAGPIEEGEAALRPLREFGPPGIDLVQPMPYVAVQRLIDDGNPKGMQNYWTADFLAELPDEAVDTLVEHATKPVSPLTQILLVPGGAPPPGSTTTPLRSASVRRRGTPTSSPSGRTRPTTRRTSPRRRPSPRGPGMGLLLVLLVLALLTLWPLDRRPRRRPPRRRRPRSRARPAPSRRRSRRRPPAR